MQKSVVLKLVFSDNISSKWLTWLDVLAAGRQLAKQNKTRQMQKWVRDKNGLFVQRKSHLIPPDPHSSTQNLGKISRAFWFLKTILAHAWSNMISKPSTLYLVRFNYRNRNNSNIYVQQKCYQNISQSLICAVHAPFRFNMGKDL